MVFILILHFQQEYHTDYVNKINICIIIHEPCGGVYQPVSQCEPTINN